MKKKMSRCLVIRLEHPKGLIFDDQVGTSSCDLCWPKSIRIIFYLWHSIFILLIRNDRAIVHFSAFFIVSGFMMRIIKHDR